MNKDSLKVKELLHLDLFIRTKIHSWSLDKTSVDSWSSEYNERDPELLTAILKLDNEYSVFGFLGGQNKSLFFIEWTTHGSSVHYRIYCPTSSDLKTVNQDLSLFKAFIKKQSGKRNHE